MLTILRPKDKFVLPRTWRTSKHETNERREASFLSVLQTNVIRSDVFLLHLLIYLRVHFKKSLKWVQTRQYKIST